MIKAIIFDFDGVLVNRFTELSVESFCRTNHIDKKQFARISSQAAAGLDIGTKTEYQYFKIIAAQLNLKITPQEIKKFFITSDKKYIKKNKEVYSLLNQLKKKYTIVLLSNVSQELAARLNKNNFYKNFDKKFFSYQLGSDKTDKNTWQYVLKKLNLKPEEIIFIDDSQKNISLAKTLKINCLLYNKQKNLKKELERYS
ncbi:HAD family hydrolase [Candidatus Parcubacteria bacterium]|nr:MAG: HAD family hydrolase [Candidatus Parcubacteria bacterium]